MSATTLTGSPKRDYRIGELPMSKANQVKVTWELSLIAASEAVLRAGGSPSDESAVQGVIRRSRHAAKYPSGVTFGRTSELQNAGYRVVGIEIVADDSEATDSPALTEIIDAMKLAAVEFGLVLDSDPARGASIAKTETATLTVWRDNATPHGDESAWAWRVVEHDAAGQPVHEEAGALDSIAELERLLEGVADQ